MRRWKAAAIFLLMALTLTSCQASTLTATPEPSPTGSQTATPTPTPGPTSTPIPELSRADVDRIGYGYLAAYVYTLATDSSDIAIFATQSYPTSYPIREGGTVTFTYATSTYPEYYNAIYILSKTVKDDSGTVTTDKPVDPTYARRWILHHGDHSIDLAYYNGVVRTEMSYDISLFIAALGTPKSDTTVDGYNQEQAWKSRKLTFDGATYYFLQFDFSAPTKNWMLVTAEITSAEYASEQGVTIGMTEADAMKACGTGYFFLIGASKDYDLWSGINVYGPDPFLEYDANVWHLNIGIKDGKVVGIVYIGTAEY